MAEEGDDGEDRKRAAGITLSALIRSPARLSELFRFSVHLQCACRVHEIGAPGRGARSQTAGLADEGNSREE